MPCNCDHLEATYPEHESRKVCAHICYLFPKFGKDIPEWIKNGAEDYYGAPKRLAEAETILFEFVEGLSQPQLDALVYDGKIPAARKLADWYDSYKEEYQANAAKVQEDEKQADAAEEILGRLRGEEVEIIKGYFNSS
jgi:hypothetical protein